MSKKLSRREFIKLAALGAASLSLRPLSRALALPEFPQADLLGRVTKGMLEVKARPDLDSATVGVVYEDTVMPWLGEVVGERPAYIFNNQRWVETPDGFIYGPLLQPVRNHPNQPVQDLKNTSLGSGMWIEVAVPYLDVSLQNEPTSNSWVKARAEEGLPIRTYYGQVFWVDDLRNDNQGRVQYRINPNYYGGVDLLWVDAAGCRPISEEELTPIHPEVTDKRVVVDINHQVISCFEGQEEVYFCRCSTGAKFDMYGNLVDKWATPVGEHRISRKYVSLQMSGGTTGAGYDLPGIGWTTIFADGGVAIHATFWHNNFGDTMSHGCVNVTPEDAKWIFRWTLPEVKYDPGMEDISLTGAASTHVNVIEF